jgi:hypothetical protein
MVVIRSKRSFVSTADAMALCDYHTDRELCHVKAMDVASWPQIGFLEAYCDEMGKGNERAIVTYWARQYGVTARWG